MPTTNFTNLLISAIFLQIFALKCLMQHCKQKKLSLHLYLVLPQGITLSEFREDVWCW